MVENSNGSPSRYLRTSPTLANGSNPWSNRAPRPRELGFGNIGENIQGSFQNLQAGPKSAPPQVNSFEQSADDENLPLSSNGLFDECWLQHPSDMYVTDTRPTSLETIFPDNDLVRSARASHAPSAYPSSTHLELLEAQYGIRNLPGSGNERAFVDGQLNPQISRSRDTLFPAGHGDQAPSAIFMGHGYDNLRAYVEMAAKGVGDGDGLPSMHHFGRDALRQFIYNCVFDAEDGSSRLSRENPQGVIEVAGQRVSRQTLHNEITHFLEDQLELMVSPDHSDQNGIRQPQQGSTLEDFNHVSDNSGTPNFNTERRRDDSNQNGMRTFPTSGAPIRHDGEPGPSPVDRFENLNLGDPQKGNNGFHDSGPRQTWDPMMAGRVPNVPNQQQLQPNFAAIAGMGPGPQGAPSQYGPPSTGFPQPQHPYHPMLQQQLNQQYGSFVPPQFMNAVGPMYLPSQGPPLTFYPGRQVVPHGSPMLPYGPQLFANPGFGMPPFVGSMIPPQYLPNPQMALSALPPHMSAWAPQPSRGMQVSSSQWVQPSERNRNPRSRSGSPMLGGTQSRAGRNIVSHVSLLPYRPGSDDMYPHHNPTEGSSVRKQELERSGPSYEYASKAENIPFVEAARQSKPAEWGVLKIGNIPYSLTKQEVLGLLGRNAKIVTPDLGVPIHIIMDRTTGKTMDCYVEFFSYGDAQAAFNKCLLRGSQLRLGDRVIDVAMTSQDALLAELFPKAKNVEWRNGRPLIRESHEPFNSGFKSFVTNEELLQLVSHAEKPHRSSALVFTNFLAPPTPFEDVTMVLLPLSTG
ncbi:MAG: hypothetical protein Q9211_001853 [Gyalolechia sp. 1 TL-2023]